MNLDQNNALDTMTDEQIKFCLQHRMAKKLFDISNSQSFTDRLIRLSVNYDPVYMRHFPVVKNGEVLIDLLSSQYGGESRASELLFQYYPHEHLSEHLFDFMLSHGKYPFLAKCPTVLFTPQNIELYLKENRLLVREIPSSVFTEEIAIIVFKNTKCFLTELPFEYRTLALARMISSADDVMRIPEVFLPDLAKEWLSGNASFELSITPPASAQEASLVLHDLAVKHHYDEARTARGIVRLYKTAMLCFDKNDLWQHRTPITEKMLISVYGRELMSKADFPVEKKRQYIESDLSL